MTRYSAVTPNRPLAICLMALHLLSPFGQRDVPLGVFAALAAVAHAAQAVHGDGQGLVGLLADGAEGHGPADEPLDDLALGLDLVQRHRRDGLEAQQAPQGALRPLLVVDERGVLPVEAVVVGARGPLDVVDGLGAPQVALAVFAIAVVPAALRGSSARSHSSSLAAW